MFINIFLPWHAPQAAIRLNGGVHTFITAKINIMLTPLNRHLSFI